MVKKISIFAIVILLMLTLIQSLALCAPANPADTLILFTPRDVSVLPGTQTLYLADATDSCLVAADLQTGQTQTLALPFAPTKVVCAGGSVYVALSTPDSGADSVAVVDPTTFTVSSTIPIDLDISGMAADGTYLYAYNSSKLEAFATTGTKLSTLSISNLQDLKANPADGNLYGVTYGSAVCIGAPAGQLSLLKQNASYSGNSVTLMPDGKNMLLNGGAVLACSSDSSKTLVAGAKLLSCSTACADPDGNELYLVADRLIQVYDASTFSVKRVLSQPEATNYLTFSSGKLIVAQKDSTNNLDFRAVDPGALLTGLKFDGDAISELYPLQFTVDGGTVPNAEASVAISATPALAGAQVSGDVGTVPLAVGKNTLSISVKNTASGNTQTYTVTVTRAAKDFPTPAYNALTNLGFIPKDFVVDPDRQVAYMTAAGGYSLFKVDLATGKITEKQFTLPAERLALNNGNIYVTLLRSGQAGADYGAVAVVDEVTFATKAIFNTDVTFGIIVDDQGYVYLAPGYSQKSIMESYDGGTGAFVSSLGVSSDNTLEWNPVTGKLYLVTNGQSPANTYAYEVANGVFGKSYGSPYWGDYRMMPYMKVSPDGKYIFNGSGCIFTSAPTQTGDMVYSGTLGSSYTSICFNLADQEFYTANGKTLTVYDYTTRTIKNVYTLTDMIVDMSYDGGKFTLLQENASQQYYVRTLAIGNHASDLASLGVSAGTLSPGFDANRLGYSLVLPAGTASVSVSPATLDSGATYTMDGSAVKSKTLTLDQGSSATVTIVVQSQDKALLQTYTLFVYRQTADRTMIISPAFFTPTQEISSGGALYLAAKDQPFLYKFDGASGTFSALPLPGVPNALGCEGNSVFAAMEDVGTNTFSIGVVDMGTFTLADSFAVDTAFTGIRGDDDTIYAFTNSVIKGYARSGHQKAFTKAINSIVDVEPDPMDDMVYVASNCISSYSVNNGQLTLIKTNSSCEGQTFTVMPDGMHLVLPDGTVLLCSSNHTYDLTLVTTVKLPSLGGFSVDATTHELFSIVDSYLINYPYRSGSYLIGVYDTSNFSYKRSISEPAPMYSVLGSSGSIYVGQKDSQGDTVLRSSYSDALLQTVKIDGDVKDGLYPLRTAVDAGEVLSSATSADIGAVAAEPGAVVSGDTGLHTLSTGKNVFSITVTDPSNGHSQTYSVTLTKGPGVLPTSDARVSLGFTPLGVALDPDRHVEYMTAANDKNLYCVDLQTGAITEKTFTVPVERLAVANGKLYATLLRSGHSDSSFNDGFGAVAVIDTATFVTSAVFGTDIDPYDIAADDTGNVYLAPGSGQWSIMASYNAETGTLLSEVGQIDYRSYIGWDCALNKIYLMPTDLYPPSIDVLVISKGILTRQNRSTDGINHDMYSYERVSPDGSRIFNGAGTMFACKAGSDGDVAYQGTLGKPFTSICFDLPDDRFYTAQDNTLTAYAYSTKKALNTLTLQDSITDLQYDGSEIVAVQKNSGGQYYTREITPDTLAYGITVAGQAISGFNPLAHDYSVTLPSTANTVDITASAFDPSSTISGNTGSQAMKSGTNTFTITITGSASKLSGTYTLHVTNPAPVSVSGIALNKTATHLYVGASEQLTDIVSPANAANKSVTWSSDDSGIASVNNGLVTGVAPGVIGIKATTVDGNFVDQCTVTVSYITVTFDSRSGSTIPNALVSYQSTVPQPVAPTKIGYDFCGWFKDSAYTLPWIFGTDKVSGDTILFAKWTIKSYTVTFEDWDGTVFGTPQSVDYDNSAKAPAAPTRAGYIFTGWDVDFSKITSNLTVTAQYEIKGSLQITCVNMTSAKYPGIGLALYKDKGLTNLIGNKISDSSGIVLFKGLDAGTYWVIVTSVPSGYSLTSSNDPQSFVIGDGHETDATYILQTSKVLAYSSDQLEDIRATAGAFNMTFDPNTNKYTLTLDEHTRSTKITPILADSTSKLYINGSRVAYNTVTLSNTGTSTTLTIKVQPKSGKAKYYYVTVQRAKSTDSAISSLKVSKGTLNKADATHFKVNLTNSQSSTTISLKLDSNFAKYTMTLDGNRTASLTISLKPGQTRTLVITVKSQAGNTTSYTVTITRAISHNNSIASLTTSNGKLDPAFTPGNPGKYKLALPSGQSGVTLKVKLADSTAKYSIKVNGITSGSTISPAKGTSMEVKIIVTSQAGDVKTYTIEVSRAS